MAMRFRSPIAATLLAGAVAAAAGVGGWLLWADEADPPPPAGRAASARLTGPLFTAPGITVWWDVSERGAPPSGPPGGASNIHPGDYAGPAACKDCHPKNYEGWSAHPHRWMNALATDETVRGDFSGAVMSYRGGRATFERRDGEYRMRLERGAVRRVYRVTQTIGSRFYQYYVGRLITGPEPPGHRFYQHDHVLPFGYWLDRREWVPVVHIGPELPDDQRLDPYDPPASGPYYAEYASSCNYCHTTFPLGDLLTRAPHQIGRHAPLPLNWSVGSYLRKEHPGEYPAAARMIEGGGPGPAGGPRPGRPAGTVRFDGGGLPPNPTVDWDAPHYAVTLGVSCEACHLGAREHAQSGGKVPPAFFPASPYLAVESAGRLDRGRTHDNVNWACGRCHTGGRPAFAAGMSTWNSVEYADAVKGACYSKLRCVDCHDPHQATGPTWSKPPGHDDAVCLKCHEQLRAPAARSAHTHHQPGGDGDRCLNCHMPRINEGVNDVVRTHMIYSPTRPDMIHANHPNACNLCHTDRPIDWTLGRLKEWYRKTYDEAQIARNYPHRGKPAALGWLASPDPAVRLVAADALTRARDAKALPELLDALDDPHLINRQFTAKGLEGMLGVRLADSGYRFYQTRDERQKPLADLRAKLLPPAAR